MRRFDLYLPDDLFRVIQTKKMRDEATSTAEVVRELLQLAVDHEDEAEPSQAPHRAVGSDDLLLRVFESITTLECLYEQALRERGDEGEAAIERARIEAARRISLMRKRGVA